MQLLYYNIEVVIIALEKSFLNVELKGELMFTIAFPSSCLKLTQNLDMQIPTTGGQTAKIYIYNVTNSV